MTALRNRGLAGAPGQSKIPPPAQCQESFPDCAPWRREPQKRDPQPCVREDTSPSPQPSWLLRELRSLSSDYNVPADGCLSYQTLYQELEAFEQDLHQHIHLENNILFPRAIELEANN